MTDFEWKTRVVKDELTGLDKEILENSGLWATKKDAKAFSGKAPFSIDGKDIQMYVKPHDRSGEKTVGGKDYPLFTVRFFVAKQLEE